MKNNNNFLRLANLFRMGIAIAVLASLLSGCGKSPVVPWESATNLPKPIQEQIESQYKVDLTSGNIWQVKGVENNRLVVVDFNSDDLCGAWGCLYSGLWMQEDSLVGVALEHYLDPHVPPERLLFSVLPPETTTPPTLPCIRTVQPDFQGFLKRIDLCFNENIKKYEVWRSATEAL